jgi:hypothetical protein
MKNYILTIAGCVFFLTTHAQTLRGGDIDGEAAADNFGQSISMPDANTFASGGRANDGAGNEAGHVRVHHWNGTAWTQKGNDIDGDTAGDFSGWAVHMPDSNTVAIGSPLSDSAGVSRGSARIFIWSGTAWTQKGASIFGEAILDKFGESIVMPDPNTVAIGSNQNDGNGSQAGHVRVFAWNGTAWVQKGSDLDGSSAGDFSGFSISMPDASTVAIGAPNAKNQQLNITGQARVFSWNGSSWVQKGSNIYGDSISDKLGQSVYMPDANTLAVGADQNDNNGLNAGMVKVFVWDGNNWIQKGNSLLGEASSDNFGRSVSMPNSDVLAVGAPGNDGNGSLAGHVRVFAWIANAWVQVGTDIDGETAGDGSGVSIAMPTSGTVAIGANFNAGNGFTNIGHVRVYDLCIPTASSASQNACGSYTWNGNTYTQSGTYTYQTTNAAGCDSTATLELTVESEIPVSGIIGNTLVDTLQTYAYSVIISNTVDSYEWGVSCGQITAGAGTDAVTVSWDGPDSCQIWVVRSNAACRDTAILNVLVDFGSGINESALGIIALYPNPTYGLTTITWGKAPNHMPDVTLLDALGRMVAAPIDCQQNGCTIDVNGLPAGVYTVLLMHQTGSVARRLIKTE